MKWMIGLVALAGILFVNAAPARAGKAEVVDDANFFSQDAIQSANKRLADVDQKYGRELRIESYGEIPQEKKSEYTEATKREFFQKWARQLAEQAQTRGVFILICREPSTLQVEVGRETASS